MRKFSLTLFLSILAIIFSVISFILCSVNCTEQSKSVHEVSIKLAKEDYDSEFEFISEKQATYLYVLSDDGNKMYQSNGTFYIIQPKASESLYYPHAVFIDPRLPKGSRRSVYLGDSWILSSKLLEGIKVEQDPILSIGNSLESD